jgi:membrane fusion protein (multidrug efflux system)
MRCVESSAPSINIDVDTLQFPTWLHVRLEMLFARLSGLVLIGATLGGCSLLGGDSVESDSTAAAPLNTTTGSTLTLPVVGEEVRVGDLVLTVTATGTIKSEATAELTAETTGIVAEVFVNPGERVKTGQALVLLDTKPLELALARSEANHRNAQARYRAEIEPDSVASGQAPTEARRAFARASSGLETAEVDLEEANFNLKRAVIRAPFTGVIESIDVAVGTRISSGSPIAQIVDLDNLRVEARVMEHDIPNLAAGGDAEVRVAAMPDKPITGRITAILPMVDSMVKSGTASIRIRGDGMLRPGMYADILLEAKRLTNRTIVPARAVIEREGRPLVFRVREGIAEWVYIRAGQTNGRETEVMPDSISGIIPLEAGDIVLIAGHLTLTHQAPVRLVAKDETSQ